MPINVIGAGFMSMNAGGSTTSIHNELSGLQGGTTNQYYHIDSSSYAKLNGQNQQIKTNSNVSFNQVTSNFKGNGSLITDIKTSNTIQDTYYFFPGLNYSITPKGWDGLHISELGDDIGNVDIISVWDLTKLDWVEYINYGGGSWEPDDYLEGKSFLRLNMLTGVIWTNYRA